MLRLLLWSIFIVMCLSLAGCMAGIAAVDFATGGIDVSKTQMSKNKYSISVTCETWITDHKKKINQNFIKTSRNICIGDYSVTNKDISTMEDRETLTATISCSDTRYLSDIHEFESSAHKEIYSIIKSIKKVYNNRNEVNLNYYTNNAKLMIEKDGKKVKVSPTKYKNIAKQYIDVAEEYGIHLKYISIESVDVGKNTAKVITRSTYFVDKKDKYRAQKNNFIFKKVGEQWKISKYEYQRLI